eukprot:scaffold7358_cov252-Pinguiococcus_pyrenoidosus.AAC.5
MGHQDTTGLVAVQIEESAIEGPCERPDGIQLTEPEAFDANQPAKSHTERQREELPKFRRHLAFEEESWGKEQHRQNMIQFAHDRDTLDPTC